MAEREVQRRLAAVLAADVAGYTRLMEENTDGTVAAWQDAREDVIKPSVGAHSGKIVKLTGDGFLVEFPTVQDAVTCAIAMQALLQSSSLKFRMGINLGDIVDDGEDIHGEGVNVAARLEGLAEPGGICISGMVYDSIRNRIDADFDDMGPQEVKNVSAPVQAYGIRAKAAAGPAPAPAKKPSIAVLPFDNLSADPEQEYFSDGITEDIITALSRIRQFDVLARNSTFTYKGEAVDIEAVAKELGVAYVLEGSVRKAGNRVRITAQLIDGETGSHIWAEKYDRELEDIFAVQDEITLTVVGAIEPEMSRVERERAKAKAPENLDAWDMVLQGWAISWDVETHGRSDDLAKARELFEQAIALDPKQSRAHSGLATCMVLSLVLGLSKDEETAIATGLEAGRRSIELDREDDLAHTALGSMFVASNLPERALPELEMAIALNPSSAWARFWLGAASICIGKPDAGITSLDKAIALSPREQFVGPAMAWLAHAYLVKEDFEQVADWAEKSLRHPVTQIWGNIMLVAALGHLGRTSEASAAVTEMLRRRPDMNLAKIESMINIYNLKFPELLLDGLRKAGVEEGE